MVATTKVPALCSHCCAEDVKNDAIPIVEGDRVPTRVIWQGLAPHPSGQGSIPVLNLDLGAGQLPNQVEFPMVARWQPSHAYCPNCLTLFYCGPDWQQLEEEAKGPGIIT